MNSSTTKITSGEAAKGASTAWTIHNDDTGELELELCSLDTPGATKATSDEVAKLKCAKITGTRLKAHTRLPEEDVDGEVCGSQETSSQETQRHLRRGRPRYGRVWQALSLKPSPSAESKHARKPLSAPTRYLSHED